MFDNTILSKHLEVVNRHYPEMNITQLGLVCLWLGVLRAAMGHEHAKATVDNYIHHKYLSNSVKKCLDYIERELLALKRSKIDIDYYKIGNRSRLRRSKNKIEV